LKGIFFFLCSPSWTTKSANSRVLISPPSPAGTEVKLSLQIILFLLTKYFALISQSYGKCQYIKFQTIKDVVLYSCRIMMPLLAPY